MADGPLRILLASPAYWPARAFGGPVVVARELVARLVERGHAVDVVTSALVDLHTRPSAQTSVAVVDGARVHSLATPLRYRWMGITPTLPWWLERLPRPDVAHVYGFRDPVTTGTAAWCRLRGVPYVFEPLGMFRARLRKVGIKRTLDRTLYRGVASSAAVVAVVSRAEADDVVAGGVPRERVVVRGNGFPDPGSLPPASGRLRAALGLPDGAQVVLYVGRIAAGKGIEHLLEAARRLPSAHVVLLGPDDRHGTMALVRAAQAAPETRGRVHVLPATAEAPLWAYPEADVFVLASAGDSFGLAAAEAAAAGTPVVVSDRAGVADCFRPGEALVVPDEREAVVGAIARVLGDDALRARLAEAGRAAARRSSWERAADLQEQIYRRAASRTAATKLSTDGP
ncbi:MAG TPA: glycosyltransferase [Gaiellaceae bacterium]|nr:glycosyltransferase [Gaiellaceae bacterium]